MPEKLHIARKHLLPKVCETNGIDKELIDVRDDALLEVISSYTREAGVRELGRQLEKLIQSLAVNILEAKGSRITIGAADLEEHLGRRRYETEIPDGLLPAGVATGLAWSPTGGSILHIESTSIPGNGQLILTGQLGDVMKESAQIAQTLVLSHLDAIGLRVDGQKLALHLHVPSGAIPKDGPSAGIALFASLMSLFLQKPVPAKFAMSGEITLRGSVNPVGGIKEKVIAAHRAGMKELLLPEKNRRDFEDVPEEVRLELQVHWISKVDQVLSILFGLDDLHIGPRLNTISEAPPKAWVEQT